MMAEESNGLQESAVSERYTFKMRGPSFSDMREQNCFTDAVITSESGFEWNVHKVVMSRLGIFVYNSFKYPSFNGTLNMSVSDEVVQCIIDLAYKGECDIHHENVLETLEAAVMYQLESLIELCIDFILGNMITAEHVISVKTCMRVCQDGLKEMTDGALTEVVDKWIRKNFNDIFETEDIYELSPEELENYIKEDDLNIQEEDLLEFILKYATKNKLESEKTIQLLANVRLSLINSSRLSEIIETNQALTVEIEKSKDIQRITNYRLPRDIVIIFKKHEFWGTGRESDRSSAEIFNIRKNEWQIVENCGIDPKDLPALPFCYGLSLGHTIYYFGTLNSKNSCKSIDLKDGHSFEGEILHDADFKYNSRHTLWNGKIVALVGSDSHPNSGTFYDPKENKWLEFPTCQISSWATLEVTDGNLFAIGGVNQEEDVIGSIEHYDSINSKWTVCGSLKRLQGVLFTAAVDGKVYVFSESGTEEPECFQPVLQNGRMSLIWLPSLKFPWKHRENWRVSVMDNKLLFTGGTDFNDEGNFISHVRECHIFSPKTGEWSRASDMCEEKCWDMAVTVNTSDLGKDRIEELCSGKFNIHENNLHADLTGDDDTLDTDSSDSDSSEDIDEYDDYYDNEDEDESLEEEEEESDGT